MFLYQYILDILINGIYTIFYYQSFSIGCILRILPRFLDYESIGNSFEGKPIYLLKICSGECGRKPAMWIDGGTVHLQRAKLQAF